MASNMDFFRAQVATATIQGVANAWGCAVAVTALAHASVVVTS